jgi:acetoin utilization protein AcuB
MKVKYWMTKDPVTVSPDDTLPTASRLMKEKNIHRLPVVEGGRLVGLVTYRNLQEARPSTATTLSVHEALYLISQLKIRDVMRKNPLTVGPEDDVLAALVAGHQKGIGGYPVMDQGRLVGIITATDLFNLVVTLFGARDRHDYVFLMENSARLQDPGYLPSLLAALSREGIALTSFLGVPWRDSADTSVVLLKVSPGPGHQLKAVEVLTAAGFKIMDQNS